MRCARSGVRPRSRRGHHRARARTCGQYRDVQPGGRRQGAALPYAESDRLVVLWGNVMRAKLERRGASYPDFLDWRGQATTFEAMAAFAETRMTLSGAGEATRILVETVSASYFPLLRVNAAAGRTFAADEDIVPEKVAVAVLSDAFWRRQLSADPHIVGKALVLDARPYRRRHHAARLPRDWRSR